MSEDPRPVKRSETLAVENAKRIAAQLRAERNDAIALAQERREQAEAAITLCRRLLADADPVSVRADLEALERTLRREP